MKRPLRCLLVTTIVAAISVHVAAAAPGSEDVPVPGGRAALAAAFDIHPVPDRARFVSEAARLIHGIPDRKAATPEALAARLSLAVASGGIAEQLPMPLTAAIWSDAIFMRQVSRDDLVMTVLGDRQASLLAHGLAGLDDGTLDYLAEHPALLTQIHTLGAESFAVFATAVHIRDNRIVPPGGDAAVALWEAVVGERVTRPDRFVSALFTRVDVRLAGLYDTVAQLDPARQRFALGLWMADPSVRLERMQALAAAAIASAADGRTVRTQPFVRTPYDLAAALARVRVDAAGRPSEPAARAFWSNVMASPELPADSAKTLAAALAEDASIVDAAWLAALTTTGDMRLRAERLDQFAFGQRVFAGSAPGEMPDVFVATRAFRRYRMLMVTLERMGIRKPAMYAQAARVATRLAPDDAERAFVATAQFQGALALLWRMRNVGTLDAGKAESLVAGLLAVPLNSSSQYLGGVVRWLDEELRPAIPAADGLDSLDAAIEAALAGPDEHASAPRIRWEGKQYRVDLAAGEATRLRRVREKLGGATLDLALDLAAAARRLSSLAPTADTVHAASLQLTSVARSHFAPFERDSALEADDFPPGVPLPPAPGNSVMRALDELERSAGGLNLPRAAGEVADAAEEAAAQALVSIAYAISLGDPEGAALLPGNVSRRHDFGFNQRDSNQRLRAAWMTPRQDVSPGVPWHLDGSLLGLDIPLATSALRRLNADALPAPTLTSNERETFAITYGLINPLLLTDVTRDAIAGAIARGRRRVLDATAQDVAAIATELNLDGWRRRALDWTATHDRSRLESMVSLRELVVLGQGVGEADLDPWGTSAMTSDGCACTRMPPPGRLPLVVGRHQIGLFATMVPDLNLHVARMLSHLRLPARLAKYVLSAAVLDFVDGVRGSDPDDWLSLVRGAAAVPQDRIEDYVAAAAADGPLVLESLQ